MSIQKNKVAIITGITGQDGSYLAEFLLSKNYVVHGIKRRASSHNSSRIDHIYQGPETKKKSFELHYGDMTDYSSIFNLINKVKPDEIYNLAAQSHVGTSFELAEYTAQTTGIGTLRILEAIRSINKKIRFYQASTSELYGTSSISPQNETTPFEPASPYGVAKLYSYWITKVYRSAYGIFACNGILFNHESPRRGDTFVSKKITKALANIKLGKQKKLLLGNLYAKRDWGHAKDYVEAQWKMLQIKKPVDLVISTGFQITVKDFVNKVLNYLDFNYEWKGKNLNEKCINLDNNKIIIEIDKRYFRPLEVSNLLGDASKSKKILKWKPTYNIDQLIKEMIDFDLNNS